MIDGPDADGSKTALCAGLWSPRSCAQGGTDRLVRITGNAPGLQSEVAPPSEHTWLAVLMAGCTYRAHQVCVFARLYLWLAVLTAPTLTVMSKYSQP